MTADPMGGEERVVGSFRVSGSRSTKPHPSDGMTAHVELGDGACSSIINPQSFDEGGPEWVMRYGNTESIRYSVASLLASYDYLLCGEINQAEAVRRLRLLRAARKALASTSPSVIPQRDGREVGDG